MRTYIFITLNINFKGHNVNNVRGQFANKNLVNCLLRRVKYSFNQHNWRTVPKSSILNRRLLDDRETILAERGLCIGYY